MAVCVELQAASAYVLCRIYMYNGACSTQKCSIASRGIPWELLRYFSHVIPVLQGFAKMKDQKGGGGVCYNRTAKPLVLDFKLAMSSFICELL